jgi:hypothetical protein
MKKEDQDREQLLQWVSRWQTVGPILEELRQKEIAGIDTQRWLLSLADAFESCRLLYPPLPTSGLVEQQALFQRLRK